MAKKKPNKPPMRQRRRRQSAEISGLGPLIFIGLVILSLFSMQVAGLVIIGLMPTFVLAMTGRGENKAYKLQCVAFANMAGVLPFAAKVWHSPHSLWSTALDPLVMVTMFGSAAVGYALIYVGPMVAAVVLQSLAQERLKTLAQQRATLVEAWGPEVLGTEVPDDPDWVSKAPRRNL